MPNGLGNISAHLHRATSLVQALDRSANRVEQSAARLEQAQHLATSVPDRVATRATPPAHENGFPYFLGISEEPPRVPGPAVAAQPEAVSSSESMPEIVTRARHQANGAIRMHGLLQEQFHGDAMNETALRQLAQSRADMLFHRLTQTVGESAGLAADDNSRLIHEDTGGLALLDRYLQAPGEASARHADDGASLARIESTLRDAPGTETATELRELLGSNAPRLQRNAQEFSYDLVNRLRNAENATTPGNNPLRVTPLARHNIADEIGVAGRHTRDNDLHSLIYRMALPAGQFVSETSSAVIRGSIAALDRGDTQAVRDHLVRTEQFIVRVRRPAEELSARQDARDQLMASLMNRTPHERNAALTRLEAEANQARETERRLDGALAGLPPQALARLANQIR